MSFIIFNDISKNFVFFAKIMENGKRNTGKIREFCQAGRVGTIMILITTIKVVQCY